MVNEEKRISHKSYSTLEMQEYFKDSKITVVQAKILFRVRTRMENFVEKMSRVEEIPNHAQFVRQAKTHRATAFSAV